MGGGLPALRRGSAARRGCGVQTKLRRFLEKKEKPEDIGNGKIGAVHRAEESGSLLLNSLARKSDFGRTMKPCTSSGNESEDVDVLPVFKEAAHSVLRLATQPRQKELKSTNSGVAACDGEPAPRDKSKSILAENWFSVQKIAARRHSKKRISNPGVAESQERFSNALSPPKPTQQYGWKNRRRKRQRKTFSGRHGIKPKGNVCQNQTEFNHYEDGSGFLDADALGFDFSSGGAWEGIGCVGMGESELEEV